MSATELKFEDGIFTLTLTNGDEGNMLSTDVLNEYNAAFEEVKAYKGNTALLVQCEHEKTFSTGINLEWMMQQDGEGIAKFGDAIHRCYLELATLDVPTVCAINGNAYAGGGIMTFAFDFRMMREDRGRICFPEVNIKIPFEEVTMAVVMLCPARAAIEEMLYTGRAFTGGECLERGLVSSLHSQGDLNQKAKERAMEMSQKDRATYGTIKREYRKSIFELKKRRFG